MAESVFIFVKQREPGVNSGLQANANQSGARVIGVESLDEFEGALEDLQKMGVSIQKLTIWSHGAPGMLDFRGDRLDSTTVRRFSGKGFENLFAAGARVIIDGCNVGAEGAGAAFLLALAPVFLSKGGGRVSARSQAALSAPLFTAEVFSFSGLDTHALIRMGGAKIRIARGNEISSPVGSWRVSSDGKNFLYEFHFGSENSVEWTETRIFLPHSGQGIWKTAGDVLRIDWESGGVDTWDLPLFTGLESGSWTTTSGGIFPISAELLPACANRWTD